MRLTKYRSGTSFGSSSASRELCCWALKVSKRGKLQHKQVERAMKAFWRQPMLRACVCAYIHIHTYIRVRVCIYNIYNTEPAPLSQTSSVHVQLNPPRVNNIERVGAKEGVANNPPPRDSRRNCQGQPLSLFFPNNLSIKGENRISVSKIFYLPIR